MSMADLKERIRQHVSCEVLRAASFYFASRFLVHELQSDASKMTGKHRHRYHRQLCRHSGRLE